MIFIDTTIWVGGIDASDKLHRDAREVLQALMDRRLPPALTTDLVLGETLTILRRRNAKASIIANAVGGVLSSSLVSVVYVDEKLFKEALSTFRKFERLSFTDSVTLTVMILRRVKEIYSHDSDFDLKGISRKERP